MYYINYKNIEYIKYILDNLRDEEVEESVFVYGDNWKNETLKNILNPEVNLTIAIDKNTNIPICMGGITPRDKTHKDIGIVWLLATDNVKFHKYALLKKLKSEIVFYDKQYRFLYNFIFYKNYLAKKWLKWLGFVFGYPQKNPNKAFQKFEVFYRIRKK